MQQRKGESRKAYLNRLMEKYRRMAVEAGCPIDTPGDAAKDRTYVVVPEGLAQAQAEFMRSIILMAKLPAKSREPE